MMAKAACAGKSSEHRSSADSRRSSVSAATLATHATSARVVPRLHYHETPEWERRMGTKWRVGDLVVHPDQWNGMPADDGQRHLLERFLKVPVRCFLRQLWLVPLRRAEYEVVRASWIATHDLRRDFDFYNYVSSSIGEDYSEVVGVSAELWVIIMVSVLLWGIIGWTMAWGIVVVAVVMMVLNAKLIWIVRQITRGGTANRIDSALFWFRAPWLLLPLIRVLLFSSSFVFTGLVFFSWQFGGDCCFFKNYGMRAWAYQPYWVDCLLAAITQVMLGHVTLPLCSLLVSISKPPKPTFLPDRVKLAMLIWAAQARTRVLSRKQQERVHAVRAAMRDPLGALEAVGAEVAGTVKQTAASVTHKVGLGRPPTKRGP